jgi:phosphoserine phosphatase RsbU/P
MGQENAMIVAEVERPADDLEAALKEGGFQVSQATPTELGAEEEPGDVPDVLLVSAELGLRQVALLAKRFATATRPPTVLVFPDDDLAALESCVRGGFDYVTPPFRPSLLRGRLTTCQERGQLTTTVEDMATAASLRRLEHDLSIAEEIQSGFLPEILKVPPGWDIAARIRPARHVGGDFYDVFELGGGRRLGVIIADVCDKGVGAALFMALIRTMLRHTAEETARWSLAEEEQFPPRGSRPPGVSAGIAPLLSMAAGPLLQAVNGTNRYLSRNHQKQGYFATVFFGVLDPASGTLLYINGGHNPPVLVRADGEHTLLEPTGPAVGVFPGSTYSLNHVSLQPGDALFMYTDGVVEARDTEGGLFGMDRTLEVVTEPGRGAHELLDAIETAVHQYRGSAEQSDDITTMAVCRAAASQPG